MSVYTFGHPGAWGCEITYATGGRRQRRWAATEPLVARDLPMSVGSMSFDLNTEAPPDAGDLDSSSDEDGGEREGGMDRTAPTLAQTSVASCAALPVSEEQEPSRSSDGNMMIRFDGGDVLDLPSYAFDVPLRTTGVQVVDILSKLYTRFEKLEEDNPGFLPELRIGGVVLESTGRLCDLGLNLEHTHTVQVGLVEQTELQKILAVAPTEWMRLQADSEPPRSFLNWKEYKTLTKSSGSLCPECWKNVCVGKKFEVDLSSTPTPTPTDE
eukprot:COSAG02_NODE_8415_length_2579_cov_1.518952_1_plen_269_part_00